MSISIIMPCYNESAIIEQVIRHYYNDIISRIDDSEFIVIDDCSSDGSDNILKMLENELPKLRILKTDVNSGHGLAVRMGYEEAQKEWVFHVDSDNQFKVGDFWKLYALRGEYELISGFRNKRNDPLIRLVLTRVIRIVNFMLFGMWIKDANCSFRLIKRELLCELLTCIDKMALAPNIMISILAKKKNKKIVEVPVTYFKRKTGNASLRGRELIRFASLGFKQLLDLKKICQKL